MLYPLTFHPIFKPRVWGGRNLERLYGKRLPPGVPVGESWEISDRPGNASVIANGALAGRDLRWLMEHHAAEVLGLAKSQAGRFPLLIKILDAAETLSLQIHPPAGKAAELGGEPKTEMWYVAAAGPGAELFVGLRRGATRGEFERRVGDGSVAACLHRVPVRAGDAMFLPSGRVHAIGAGNVLFEIQQNSDTTYRVFDWNRPGLDGKPRTLHLAESLASLDFGDFEPALIPQDTEPLPQGHRRPLVDDPLFTVDALRLAAAQSFPLAQDRPTVIGVLDGRLAITGGGETVELQPGAFGLVPAAVRPVELRTTTAANVLRAVPG
jgi:mannose-6-phosphate isomerase